MRKLIAGSRASALSHKQTLKRLHLMSALPPKADIAERDGNVRFVPEADMSVSSGFEIAWQFDHPIATLSRLFPERCFETSGDNL